MIRFYCLALLCIIFAPLAAQKHDYNAIIGYAGGPTSAEFGNMRLTFQTIPPQVYSENRGVEFQSCGGTVSDSVGNLLFYTNGIGIYNAQNQVIENGWGINPGPVWNSSQPYGYVSIYPVFALPKPGSANVYYLIHSDVANANGDSFVEHLYYTIVDVAANNGAGKVLAKNQVLLEGNLMWPSAVKHGNGRDWWIMGLKKGDTRHYLFLLSAAGITGPFIQDIGPAVDNNESAGKSIFSQSGNLYVRLDAMNSLRLYDFDRCTGNLSNLRILPFDEGLNPWSTSFSANDRFVYLARPRWIWTLDLKAPDIAASFDTLAHWELNYCPYYPFSSHNFMGQTMPDDKIYFTTLSGATQCMNVIHRPNLPGDAADAEEAGLSLPRWNSFTTHHFPNYRLGEWDDAPCDTLNGQMPKDGFLATFYPNGQLPVAFKDHKYDYATLQPLPVASCTGCTDQELKLMNNPLQWACALAELRRTGKLPATLSPRIAEQEGLYLAIPEKK